MSYVPRHRRRSTAWGTLAGLVLFAVAAGILMVVAYVLFTVQV